MALDSCIARIPICLVLMILFVGTHSSDCQADDQQTLQGLLSRYCVECHGADNQEADVRLDTLDLAGEQPADGEGLVKILDIVSLGRMPPEDVEQPTAEERSLLLWGLERRLDALTVKSTQLGRWTGKRRLTVEEYNFTMQALFGVDAEFADMLPADPLSERGYRNDGERLGLSSLQVEAYLDSARRAVERYVQFGELNHSRLRYHVELEELFYATEDRYGTRKQAPQPIDESAFAERLGKNGLLRPTYVDPLGPRLPGAFSDDETLRAAIPKLNQQYVAISERLAIGEMIVRIRAAGTPDRSGRYPRMRVEAGITLGDGCSMDKRVLGEVDVIAPRATPNTYEFRMRLEDIPTKGPLRDGDTFDQLSVFDMDQIFISNVSCDRHAVFALGRGGYANPNRGSEHIASSLKQMADDGVNFLHLDCLGIEMVPGSNAENQPYRWRLPTAVADAGDESEHAVAEELLGQFMRNAYRRPIAAVEIDTKLELFQTLRGQRFSFEDSLRETLAAVLVSPAFLYLESSLPVVSERDSPESTIAESTKPEHEAGQLTAHQIASRLSYLLWLSPPDERLTLRADDGSLREREVLLSETRRLLSDRRSRRFLESFCRQWLRLDKLPNVAINRPRYPSYDDDLAALAVRETLDYFIEVFTSDSNALDLLDSDYAMLNDRLAEHYEIDHLVDGRLRRVPLPEHSARGGLLTQASVMTMNSDGVDSHPIRRGAWLLDRILNQPPPPPPPNVPVIDENDPEFQGLSLKERIERHRQPGACQSCHKKIDPWGMPFENLDATGRWRDQIGDFEGLKSAEHEIDSSSRLPGGQEIAGVVELKRFLRQDRSEQFASALVHHLLTYAMGRPPGYAEHLTVKEIEARFAGSQYRMKELVFAIIDSPIFLSQ